MVPREVPHGEVPDCNRRDNQPRMRSQTRLKMPCLPAGSSCGGALLLGPLCPLSGPCLHPHLRGPNIWPACVTEQLTAFIAFKRFLGFQ